MAEIEETGPVPDSGARAALERACADLMDGRDRDAMGRMLAAIAREYTRARERECARPVFGGEAVTVTEVAVLASAMMDEVELEVFELGMWKSLGSV